MKTIRRSGAYDLPPNADTIISEVTVALNQKSLPKIGDILTIKAYCGLNLIVKIVSIETDCTGWRGKAVETINRDDELRALGVFIPKVSEPMQFFDSQVINN